MSGAPNMKKRIEWWDLAAQTWRKGYFLGYTTRMNTVIESDDGGVVVLLDGTAELRDINKENHE